MRFFKKCAQILMIPIIVNIASFGLALFAVCGAGPWKVFKQVTRNIFILTPRVPSLIKQFLNDKTPKDKSDPWYEHYAILIIGMPFIFMMIILDDFE